MRALCTLALVGCVSLPDSPIPDRTWTATDDAALVNHVGPRLTYDTKRKYAVLRDATTGALYRLDVAGKRWVPICAGAMQATWLAGFAYDPMIDRYVVAGGADFDDNNDNTWAGIVADVAMCDPSTDTWSAGPALPTPRASMMMVYDDTQKLLRIVGGVTSVDGAIGLDTLESTADVSAWVSRTPAMPHEVGALGTSVTYDHSHQRILALGDDTSKANDLHDDLWALTGTGDTMTWTQLCTACTGITRIGAGLVHLGARDETYELGGFHGDDTTSPAGTWFIQDDGGTLVDPTSFPPRDSFGVVYDPDRDVVVVFAGNNKVTCPGSQGDCGDTWELSPAH